MSDKMTMKTLSEKLGVIETTQVEIKNGPLSGVTLNMKRTLTMSDAMRFIANVVGSCIDFEKAEYIPEAYDFALKANTVSQYADIPFGKYSAANVYRLMYETDIYSVVFNSINHEQYGALVEAIDNRIEYTKNMLTSSASQKATELLTQLYEFSDAAIEMTEQIRSIDFSKVLDGSSLKLAKHDTAKSPDTDLAHDDN